MMDSIIVPLDIQALPVGIGDASLRTVKFAGPTTDFTQIGGNSQSPNTSESLLRPLSSGPAVSLQKGVHLHWAMPDALAHGRSQRDGRFLFPQVPNRWLVTRLLDGKPKQWVVESDRLMLPAEYAEYYKQTGRYATPVPCDDERKLYRYLGRTFDAGGWKEDATAARQDSLTAVGYGGEAFAAYYPDCAGVFGFHDTLADVPLQTDVTLSYFIVGWYSEAKKDPSSTELPEGWEFSQPPVLPARTLCGGAVREVPWNSAKDWVRPGPDLSSIKAAVGNSTTEAFAALLAAAWSGPAQGTRIEFLLDAFQLGLLPKQDLVKIEDALHQNAFGSTDGGALWLVKKKPKPGAPPSLESETLPDELAHLLNDLNDKQQALDQRRFELDARRRQLYLDWYRYIYTLYPGAGTDPDADAITDAEKLVVSQLSALGKQAALTDADVKAAQESLNALLPDDYELMSSPAPRYWHPNEPVLLLSGEALKPVSRNGAGKAACRLSSELEDAPAVVTPVAVPCAAEADKLLVETWTADSPGDHKWRAPWLPLFLSWKVAYKPVARDADGNYAARHVLDNFSLDANHIDLQPKQPLLSPEESYHGDIPLSLRAAHTLAQQVALRVAEDPELEKLAVTVKGLPLLSQSFSGVNLNFLGRKQTVQLPPSDKFNDDPDNVTETRVKAALSGAGAGDAAPLPDHEGVIGFNPLRAGVLRLTRVEVVDAFGQRAALDSPKVIASAALQAKNLPGDVYLPPRLVQPSRLLFRWLSASGEGEMNDHPATTPICGWVIPNHWENNLVFHTAEGSPLGALSLEASSQPVWRRAPDGQPCGPTDAKTDLAARPGLNSTLRDFIVAAQARPKAFLADLLTAIETACLNILPGTDPPGLGVLIGRPLALAEVALGLELQGLPAADTRWPAFKKDAAATRRVYDHSKRQQAGLAGVKLAVRLGDLSHSSDGLVGYYTGDGNFYSAAADPNNVTGVKPPDEAQIQVSKDTAPQRVTLLLDPRVSVHATTGVLPVKAITIPPDQYARALAAMQVTFLANPVLVGEAGVKLPLPIESGYRWVWLRVGKDEVTLKENQADDRAGLDYSPQRIEEGWLKLCK
jgi:hypothetical protein